jgi:DNA-binding XRE family transcriptional regulator
MKSLTMNNLGAILEENGQSQVWLSRKSGVHKTTINRIVMGSVKKLSLDIAFKVASALNRTMDEVFVIESGKANG